jgi:hypothetical protein
LVQVIGYVQLVSLK